MSEFDPHIGGSPNIMLSEPWMKAVRMVNRLPQGNGPLTNSQCLLAMLDHFVHKKSIADVAYAYLPSGHDPTIIQKLLARHEGKESSRRVDVRRIFFQFMKESGLGDTGVEEYSGKQGSRGGVQPNRAPSAKPFLRKIDGAVQGKTSPPK